MKFKVLPEEEKWRVPLILELLETRYKSIDLQGFEIKEINDMINDACTG